MSIRLEVPLQALVTVRMNCDGTDSYDDLWRKVFGKLQVTAEHIPMGFAADPERFHHSLLNDIGDARLTPGVVQQLLGELSSQKMLIVTLDEFDRIPKGEVTRLIADTIKSLSDNRVQATIVLVGVGDSIAELVQGHESVGRHLVEVPLPRMSRDELEKIVKDRLPKLQLGIDHNALKFVSLVSAGLPYFTHVLGQHAVCQAIDADADHITKDHVDSAMRMAIEDSEREMKTGYYEATKSRHPKSQFAMTLAACALARHDDFGYFTATNVREALEVITGHSREISTFAEHLKRFCDPKKGNVLQASGEKHQMRYRFREPLMEPFVLIRSLDSQIIKLEHMKVIAR